MEQIKRIGEEVPKILGGKIELFWFKWSFPTRVLYLSIIGLILTTFAFLFFYYFLGIGSVLDWTIDTEIQSVEVTVETIRHKIFELPFKNENYVVFQSYAAGEIRLSTFANYFYFSMLILSFSILLSVVTTYKKFIWFALGMAGSVAWLTFLNLDLLGAFGQFNQIPLGIGLILFLSVSYYLNAINQKVIFIYRFLIFLFLNGLFFGLLLLFSSVDQPIIHLASFGSIVPALLVLVFLVVIATELPQLAISVITLSRPNNPWSTPLNFLIICVLYFGTLILNFFYMMGDLEWKTPFNIYVFFLLFVITGIWTHRKRSVLYAEILPYAPGGSFLYLGLALLSVSTIGYFQSIALSPAIRLFNFAFLATQISFGIAFFAYCIRNFYKPMVTAMPIFKMVYDPRLMPHSWMRALGITLIMFFAGRISQDIPNYANSSLSTLKGNFYMASGDEMVAITNYSDALKKYPGSHFTSYTLAQIYKKQGRFDLALKALSEVRKEDYSPYLFSSLVNMYDSEESLKRALVMQDALKYFPESPEICNNIGLVYYKLGILDSALHYLAKSQKLKSDDLVASNILGICAMKKIGLDKLELQSDFLDNLPYLTNAYAYANANKKKLDLRPNLYKILKTGDGVSLSLANNLIDYKRDSTPEIILEALKSWIDTTSMNGNIDNMRYIYGKSQFLKGNYFEGIKLLEFLSKKAADSQIPYYLNILGYMQLKAGAEKDAYSSFFNSDQILAMDQNNIARENCMILALDQNDLKYAQLVLPSLALYKPEKKERYMELFRLLSSDQDTSLYQKVAKTIYLNPKKGDELSKFINSVGNVFLKNQLIAIFLEKSIIDKDKNEVQNLSLLMPQEVADQMQAEKLNELTIRATMMFGNQIELEKRLESITLTGGNLKWSNLAWARILSNKGDEKMALEKYESCVNQFYQDDIVYSEYLMFLAENTKKADAYDKCASYLHQNPRTVLMLQTYIELSFQMNMTLFIQDTLNELSSLMSHDEFIKYSDSVNKRLQTMFE